MKLHTSSAVLLIIVIFTSVECWDDEISEPVHRTRRDLQNVSGRKLKVVLMPVEPYVMQKPLSHGKEWEGFLIDLLNIIEHRLGLTLDLYPVPDGRYGARTNDSKYETGWTGMIGEILKRDTNKSVGADLAAAPLTITAAREQVVNFLKPFQHGGLTILIKKPSAEDGPKETFPVHFQVLEPFAADVWALCTLAVLVVAAVIWGMNKINPYEWGVRHNFGRATEDQADTFNLSGALWFAFTTLQWQGYERSPRSAGSRVLAAFWFCFVTITLVTYTGALLNHLFWVSTVHGKDPLAPPFKDLAGLLMHPKYDYGTMANGSTYTYLTETARGVEFIQIKKYFETKKGQKNLYPPGKVSQGLAKVDKGKYALILESGFAKHIVNRKPCNYMTVGDIFAPRAMGMAVSQNMERELAEALHTVILELHEEGELEALEQKWWVDQGECWNVTQIEESISRVSMLYLNQPKQITADMFWGPLLLLLLGVIFSIMVGVAEVFYFRYKGRYDPKNRPGGAQLKLEEDGI